MTRNTAISQRRYRGVAKLQTKGKLDWNAEDMHVSTDISIEYRSTFLS